MPLVRLGDFEHQFRFDGLAEDELDPTLVQPTSTINELREKLVSQEHIIKELLNEVKHVRLEREAVDRNFQKLSRCLSRALKDLEEFIGDY